MILQFKLKKVRKISEPYCITLKTQWLGGFTLKSHIFCTAEVRGEFFRNGQRYEHKRSVSYPQKYERSFYSKNKWGRGTVLHGV